MFCGSSPGRRPEYIEEAEALGQVLVQAGIGLVYGGASVGIMGRLARAVLDAGGEVIGVMPHQIAEMEVAFTDLADLRIVGSMHERKALMAELSAGFIALPGGLGTLEEFFEVLTWGQLGMHAKPCGLLNVAGYFDPLIRFLDHTMEEQFVHAAHRDMIVTADSADQMIERFKAYQPPQASKAEYALKKNSV